MPGRKRSRFHLIPRGHSRIPADPANSSPSTVSKEQQEEREFLGRFLKLADIALSMPPKSRRDKIA